MELIELPVRKSVSDLMAYNFTGIGYSVTLLDSKLSETLRYPIRDMTFNPTITLMNHHLRCPHYQPRLYETP